ncbi:MAG: hypothetical protein AB7F19_01785 [Candidatus Babeliales bacterium]
MPIMTRRLLALFTLVFLTGQQLSAYIYDNRFFRILEVPYSRERFFYDPNCDAESGHWGESRYRNDFFFLTANNACGRHGDVGFPEIFGDFSLTSINNALNRVNPSRISPLFEGTKLPGRGKLEGQGISFAYDQQLLDWLACGVSFSFLHMNTALKFLLAETTAGRMEDEVRRAFNRELGLASTTWRHSGITDVDAYIRFGNVWNYILKCRRVDAGVKFGTLFPTGVTKDLANPASVPFGGNGHYGFYVGLDGQFELKEDLKVGLISRLIKRIPKTALHRVPVAGENELFGALVAPFKVNPGITFVFAPYLRLEGIRDGLGVMVNYTLVWHDNDEWKDRRPLLNRIPPVDTGLLFKNSNWAAEEVTLNFFYDFSKVEGCNRFLPLVSLSWDIPVCYLIAENVVQTNNIALGIEFTF